MLVMGLKAPSPARIGDGEKFCGLTQMRKWEKWGPVHPHIDMMTLTMEVKTKENPTSQDLHTGKKGDALN